MLAREYSEQRAGGAELQQVLLARALARTGWSVSMVVADLGQRDETAWDGVKTYKAYRPDEGIPVIRFLHPRFTKLKAALERADADIYYTSCAGGLLAQMVFVAHRRGRRAAFRLASDTDCDPRSLLVRYWRDRQLYRWGLARADLVLAQTAAQRHALERNFARDSVVVDSLLDASGPCPPFAARDLDVLWVGNLRTLKRPQLLLDAAARLPGLAFHMIGGAMPGERRLYEQIRLRAALLPNVTFHGFVPQHRIGGYFARARLLVSTSEIEGFPNTFLQAWSRGTPVITFLDPQHTVAGRGLGAVVTDAAGLVGAIGRLAADVSHWQAASERSRRYIEERGDAAATVSAYAHALTGLLPTGAADLATT